jgi:hypothetical protein
LTRNMWDLCRITHLSYFRAFVVCDGLVWHLIERWDQNLV